MRIFKKKDDSKVPLAVDVTSKNFDEVLYLSSNPDVKNAVEQGYFSSGKDHYEKYGKNEVRRMKTGHSITEMQQKKLERIKPLLNLNMDHVIVDGKHDFLTSELREEFGVFDTDSVSSHDYSAEMMNIVNDFPNGLVLDFGAGNRGTYFKNVVNYEIVNYQTTDVIGVGEILPFNDNSFDGIISNAVLEHVKNPMKCAAEMARVLKPGGKLWVSSAFMSPLHGYPSHYFNMTAEGLKTIFEPFLEIDYQEVPPIMSPIYSLRWIVHLWASGLEGDVRQEFENLKVGDLLKPMGDLENASWIQNLPEKTNFELAACTAIAAHKPLDTQ